MVSDSALVFWCSSCIKSHAIVNSLWVIVPFFYSMQSQAMTKSAWVIVLFCLQGDHVITCPMTNRKWVMPHLFLGSLIALHAIRLWVTVLFFLPCYLIYYPMTKKGVSDSALYFSQEASSNLIASKWHGPLLCSPHHIAHLISCYDQ